jgi:hypothetical protein
MLDMDAKTKFLELKQVWKKAGEVERPEIEREMDAFLASLSEKEKEAVFEAIDSDFDLMHKEVTNIKEVAGIRDKLAPVLSVISVSYLAKSYFHKTPQWFYQRLNGSLVNGRPASFTAEEKERLKEALQDIGHVLQNTSLEIA